jgi:hypothetical protein
VEASWTGVVLRRFAGPRSLGVFVGGCAGCPWRLTIVGVAAVVLTDSSEH